MIIRSLRRWLTRGRTAAQRKEGAMFEPKLVALDIDGTLVDANSVMPRRVHAAVRRVVDAGVPVVLSTGRSWLSVESIFEELGLPPGWAVASNGAMVVTYPPFEIKDETRFDPEAVVRQVAELAPQARIAVQDGLHWRVNRHFPEGELVGDVSVQTIDELVSREVSRVIVRDPDTSEEAFAELVGQLGLQEVAYFVGWSSWLDIAPQGVDKAFGLDIVCRDLGVRREDVLAIGDGYNDIEMLQWAGRGVAMGDAADEVKQAANDVTGGFLEFGTAVELERWFPAEEAEGAA